MDLTTWRRVRQNRLKGEPHPSLSKCRACEGTEDNMEHWLFRCPRLHHIRAMQKEQIRRRFRCDPAVIGEEDWLVIALGGMTKRVVRLTRYGKISWGDNTNPERAEQAVTEFIVRSSRELFYVSRQLEAQGWDEAKIRNPALYEWGSRLKGTNPEDLDWMSEELKSQLAMLQQTSLGT
jgi:hypothetical protein